ncbi:hypothetical protein FRC19_000794 [Serendipita sp. 401]|nr:hypothetical protein FRC19_000794 [Serendipita sp. 401]
MCSGWWLIDFPYSVFRLTGSGSADLFRSFPLYYHHLWLLTIRIDSLAVQCSTEQQRAGRPASRELGMWIALNKPICCHIRIRSIRSIRLYSHTPSVLLVLVSPLVISSPFLSDPDTGYSDALRI